MAKAKDSEKRPARPAQKFVVSHQREEDFRTNGLRTYAKYRDLGLAAATHGMVQAHVIRLIPPCRPEEVSKLHYHEVDFQMVYVLKGWVKFHYEGVGEVELKAGSCVHQPPGIRHIELSHSDDLELIEIVLPADFETVTHSKA